MLSSAWRVGSFTLSIALISISCVFGLPLFPNRRKANDAWCVLGLFLYLLSSVFLFYESRGKLKFVYVSLRRNCNSGFAILGFNLDDYKIDKNYLACAFFGGYIGTSLWRLSNEIHFAISMHHCFSFLVILSHFAKILFASLLMIAINIKTTLPAGIEKVSIFGWAFVGAVCFSASFWCVVEEVILGYISIVELSIHDTEYGLNITGNATAAEYVPEIFKQETECLEHVFFPEFAEYILELNPFSTEFCALAAFFCFVTWKNVGEDQILPKAPTTPPAHHVCDHMCWFSFEKWNTIMGSFLAIVTTGVSIYYFYYFMGRKYYDVGQWIFIAQRLILQLVLVASQAAFQVRHMKKMPYTDQTPSNFHLDSAMLVFPLLPLGILYVVRVFPDMVTLANVPWDRSSLEPLYVFINLFVAIFNWVQVAYQAVFISQVFCRSDYGGLKSARYFFGALAAVNSCIWLSWTLECKLLAMHSPFMSLFGVVEFILIMYSTVPFALFCFAHATSCFLEILTHVSHAPALVPPAPPVMPFLAPLILPPFAPPPAPPMNPLIAPLLAPPLPPLAPPPAPPIDPLIEPVLAPPLSHLVPTTAPPIDPLIAPVLAPLIFPPAAPPIDALVAPLIALPNLPPLVPPPEPPISPPSPEPPISPPFPEPPISPPSPEPPISPPSPEPPISPPSPEPPISPPSPEPPISPPSPEPPISSPSPEPPISPPSPEPPISPASPEPPISPPSPEPPLLAAGPLRVPNELINFEDKSQLDDERKQPVEDDELAHGPKDVIQDMSTGGEVVKMPEAKESADLVNKDSENADGDLLRDVNLMRSEQLQNDSNLTGNEAKQEVPTSVGIEPTTLQNEKHDEEQATVPTLTIPENKIVNFANVPNASSSSNERDNKNLADDDDDETPLLGASELKV